MSFLKETLKEAILAPMVRGSELAFRQLVRKHGVKVCYSPMLRAEEVIDAYKKWRKGASSLSDFRHEDGALLFHDICIDKDILVIQLCGSDVGDLYEATMILLELQISQDFQLIGIDLNLGCPQKCAEDGNFGAFLVENNPDLAIECVSSMREAIDHFEQNVKGRDISGWKKPFLSCKMRLLESNDETISFAKRLEDTGIDMLAVHCRHRIDKFGGEAMISSGKKVVESLSIPIIINGENIRNLEDIENLIQETKAHGCMVARAFLQNPRLLNDSACIDPSFLASDYLNFVEQYPPPSPVYIQKHLRWIYRIFLQPKKDEPLDYENWKHRLWNFLARPYLTELVQFRHFIALYSKLNKSPLPESLSYISEPSFHSIRHHKLQDDDDFESYECFRDEFNIQAIELLFHT